MNTLLAAIAHITDGGADTAPAPGIPAKDAGCFPSHMIPLSLRLRPITNQRSQPVGPLPVVPLPAIDLLTAPLPAVPLPAISLLTAPLVGTKRSADALPVVPLPVAPLSAINLPTAPLAGSKRSADSPPAESAQCRPCKRARTAGSSSAAPKDANNKDSGRGRNCDSAGRKGAAAKRNNKDVGKTSKACCPCHKRKEMPDPDQRVIFPFALRRIIENPDHREWITWTDDGKEFQFSSWKNLTAALHEQGLRATKRSSVSKNMHDYKFARQDDARRPVPGLNNKVWVRYRHECFERDHPELMANIKRMYRC